MVLAWMPAFVGMTEAVIPAAKRAGIQYYSQRALGVIHPITETHPAPVRH